MAEKTDKLLQFQRIRIGNHVMFRKRWTIFPEYDKLGKKLQTFFILTPVVPPPVKVISTGLFVFQAPRVKSGTSTEFDRLESDC